MILIVNLGSASKKYALYDGKNCVMTAHFERDSAGFSVSFDRGDGGESFPLDKPEYDSSLKYTLRFFVENEVIPADKGIHKAGIRIVAPGEYFTSHRKIDKEYMKKLSAAEIFSPLHIEPVLREIGELSVVLPNAEIIGISDSAYHKTMPEEARRYAIPEKETEALGLYRFGYHGISLSSIVRKLKALPGGLSGRVIVCHLGGGASVSALRNGESVDTSMGFTPLEGMPSGTRSGTIDASATLALLRGTGMSPEKLYRYLNYESGLYALSGGESEVRDLLEMAKEGDLEAEEADFALSFFSYQAKKYIGAYIAALCGLDTLVFTGTIGERSPEMRRRICAGLNELGIILDKRENELFTGSGDGHINELDAPVNVFVLKSDETAEMAEAVNSVE